MTGPTLGSLCSGAGGLDLAVEAVFGATTVWHCELNPAAAKVLAHSWPTVPNHGDLINTDWASVEPVDIVCAGWPCQPFSLAGKRKGADDERALWPYIAGAIRMVRPRIVVLENVAAVLGPEFQRVANDLAALGYDIGWTCLRASDVGAPHRRERLFVVAAATDTDGWRLREDGLCDELGRTDEGGWPSPIARCSSTARQHATDPSGVGWVEGRPEPAGQQRGFDAAVSGDGPVNLLPTPCAQQSGNTPENHLAKKPGRKVVTDLAILVENGLLSSGGELLPTPTSRDHKGRNQRSDDTCLTGALLPTPTSTDGTGGKFSRGGDELLLGGLVRTLTTQWGKYESAIRRWEQVTRPAPAPTEPNRNGNPRLAPAFSEWLLGWPAGWVTQVPGLSRNDQLRIIGNGVVPQQAAAALRHLLAQAVVA